MKRSHYQTPRTDRDAEYHSWADPIEYHEGEGHSGLLPLGIGVAICIVAILVLAFR